ncbi:Triphosphate tunnel metalloenzyme 3 [Linum perenne]
MLRRKPTKIEVTIDDKDELEEARRPSSAAAASEMEIEVKLSLPNAESHARFKTLISQSHLKTVNQRNLFFDTPTSALSSKRAVLRLRFLDETSCVVSLKAKAVLVDGVSRVEEDEEEIDPGLGRACADDPRKLGSIDSTIVRRCKDEFGDGKGEIEFVCLGGFENVRDVYDWRELKLEVDETKYSFGVCYEIECENEDPARVKKELEGFLKDSGIEYKYSVVSKFAAFRSGKLPL